MSTRERIIEGKWNCTSCDTKGIPARFKNCPRCNNPREGGKESDFEFGGTTETGASTLETVTDEKALDMANAGVDWLCHFCGTANRGDKPKCRNCGSGRDGAEKDAVKDEPAPPTMPAPPAHRRPRRSRLWRYLAGVAAVLAFSVFWGSRTHEQGGRVAAKTWTRVVHREVFSRFNRQGWLEELSPSPAVMPVNGGGERGGVQDIRDCSLRQRGTRQVPDGTERVCRSKTRRQQCGTEEKCEVKKLKNGFAKETCRDVPKYCDQSYQDCQLETRYRSEPVYGRWCVYTTWDWQGAGDRQLSGHEDAPHWPEVAATPLERQRREEKYTVAVAYERKGEHLTYEAHPTDEAGFAAWTVGAPVKLRVSNLGSVSEATPGL